MSASRLPGTELTAHPIARQLDRLGPGAGGAVMATGIVSVALRDVGATVASGMLLVLCGMLWLVLAGVFAVRLMCSTLRWRQEARSPVALTGVAGSAVLGARLTLLGWTWAGLTLLGLATLLFGLVMTSLIGGRPISRAGHSFLIAVAPQSLAVLCALLASRLKAPWLALGALTLFGIGVCAYGWVLVRFDAGQLTLGAGDHWVAGGALAIATLACSELSRTTEAMAALHRLHQPLRVGALMLWGLSMIWLIVLVAAEIRRPRWRFDERRWATIFPLGMYAAMSFSVGSLIRAPWMIDFARVWTWLAVLAWSIVAFGALRAAALRPNTSGGVVCTRKADHG